MAFISAKVAVFVDGCFWHGCPTHATWPRANAAWWREKIEGNIRRDRNTDSQLRGMGWRVIRCWEHEDSTNVARRIARAIRTTSR